MIVSQYRCPACKCIVERVGTVAARRKSYCSATGKDVVMKKVKEKK